MRRVLAVLIALVTALGIVGWRSTSTASVGRTAAPLATIGNSSVTGNYSVLMTFHDPVTGQEGNGAGTFVFNGEFSKAIEAICRITPSDIGKLLSKVDPNCIHPDLPRFVELRTSSFIWVKV